MEIILNSKNLIKTKTLACGTQVLFLFSIFILCI